MDSCLTSSRVRFHQREVSEERQQHSQNMQYSFCPNEMWNRKRFYFIYFLERRRMTAELKRQTEGDRDRQTETEREREGERAKIKAYYNYSILITNILRIDSP